jgi:uncharacterized membrane protein YtjA (UPF0391 family)
MSHQALSGSRPFPAFVPPAPQLRTHHLVTQWKLLHWRFLMLRWALGLLLAAMVTGFFAFVGLASPAAAVARILFFGLLAGFFAALLAGLMGGRKSGA